MQPNFEVVRWGYMFVPDNILFYWSILLMIRYTHCAAGKDRLPRFALFKRTNTSSVQVITATYLFSFNSMYATWRSSTPDLIYSSTALCGSRPTERLPPWDGINGGSRVSTTLVPSADNPGFLDQLMDRCLSVWIGG